MTPEEYGRICDRLARKAIQYAAEMSADDNFGDDAVACPKCKQPVDAPCVFTNSGQEAPQGFVHNERAVAASDARCEHWIDVFLDEHLPDVDPDVLLAVTRHADAYEKIGNGFIDSYLAATGYAFVGQPAPSAAVTALHAFQADVWDAINRMESTADPSDEETVARGMLKRYRTSAIAMEMAHWHAMDHAADTEGRARWLRVRSLIERLSKESRP